MCNCQFFVRGTEDVVHSLFESRKKNYNEFVMNKIGLIGRNGSGKSIACHYFEKMGYQVYSLSDSLRTILRAEGKSLDRDSLTQRANELKKSEGLATLARRGWAATKMTDKVVFDSIRHPDEARYLKEKGVVLIGVTASIEARYKRIQSRRRETDHINFETFKRQDTYESDGQSIGQNITATLALCTTHIENSGTIEAFQAKLKDSMGTLSCRG